MTEAKRQRPYKQVARAQAKQRTRETLLQVASEELQREGFEQASLESMAERAGVTKQTALRHFGSKKGLLDEVLRRTTSLVVKDRDAVAPGDVRGAVASLVRHYECYGEITTRLLPYRDAVVRVFRQGDRESLVRRTIDHSLQAHEDWVLRTFEPQLATLKDNERERRASQLIAICSVYTWKLLRLDMGMSAVEVKDALVDLIERLLEPGAEQKRPPKPAAEAKRPRKREVEAKRSPKRAAEAKRPRKPRQ
jgi:AcrR family transcriptional regulator